MRIRFIYKILTLALLLCVTTVELQAQFSSEEDLKKEAGKLFDEEKFTDALPLYSQLLSLYPKDPNYNYKYGACSLLGSNDKEKPLKYLKFAVTKANVDPLAFYYLGKGLHLNYQFAKAESNYNKFKSKSTSKEHLKYTIDRQIEMCKNGQKLLSNITDIAVLEKKEVRSSEFFRGYKLDGIGGKIIVKPDEFKTKYDLKQDEYSIIHFDRNTKMVIFSSYGKDGKNGKDIFKVVQLPNGEWSKPSTLGSPINTSFDEDYPFLHPDGKTLYFSSKGHNSMGGYDVFKTTLNKSTGQWSYPENIDFAINTPDDDILYISDADNRLAYFASNRASKQGKITVYKVQVEAKSTETTIVKGHFLAEDNPSNKKVKISILDVEKDRRYGTYTSNEQNGEYILIFPTNGGKYKILVETTAEAPIHSAIIELPVVQGFRALKQELRLVGLADKEKLVVKNLFDEFDEFDVNDPLYVQAILKEKAKLDVNTSEEDLENSLQTSLNAALNDNSYSNLSDDELISNSSQTADQIINQAKKSREQSNYAFNIANDKSKEAKTLFKQSETLSAEAESLNGADKENKIKEAKKLKYKAAKLVDEVVALQNIARTLDNEAVERESDVAQTNKLKATINSQVNSSNRTEAEAAYKKLDEISEATYHKESALVTEETLLKDKFIEKEVAYTKTKSLLNELKNREITAEAEIKSLKATLTTTKKKSEKENIQAQLDAAAIDLEDIKFDIPDEEKKELVLKGEYEKSKIKYNSIQKAIESVDSSEGHEGVAKDETIETSLGYDIAYFENKGLVGLQPVKEETIVNEDYVLNEHKDEFDIINEDGEISDYTATYSSDLIELDNIDDENEKAQKQTELNNKLITNINEEITIRENQLKSTQDGTTKNDIEEKIAELKVFKADKEKENLEQLAVVNSVEDKNEDSNVETEIVEPENSIVIEEVKAQEPVNIIDSEGNVIDYSTEFNSTLANLENDESPEATKTKAETHEQWANAIEQELAFKKLKKSESGVEDKALDAEIHKLENDLAYQEEVAAAYRESLPQNEIEEESNLPVENLAENSNVTVKEVKPQEPVNIIDSEGNVIDYTTVFNSTLASIEDDESPEATKTKAETHEQWANAIEQELLLKKLEKSESGVEDKALDAEINKLENDLAYQEEVAIAYRESLPEDEVAENVNEEIEKNNDVEEIESNEVIENRKVEKSKVNPNIDLSQFDTKVVSETGKVVDYSSEFDKEMDEADNANSEYDVYAQKADIALEWSETIDEEIKFRNEELKYANETEKTEISNQINLLIAKKSEKQTLAEDYQLLAEESSKEIIEKPKENNIGLTENEIIDTEPVIASTEEESISNTNNKEVTSTEVKPVVIETIDESKLTVNNLDAEEDEFSSLKYNNVFDYKSTQSKYDVESAIKHKNEAKQLAKEADELNATAVDIETTEERMEVFAKADEITKKSEEKQLAAATSYGKANKTEYYNNSSVLSKLKKQNPNTFADEVIMADLLMEESDLYFEQAQLKREEAKNETSFSAKESILQKAYETEMNAIEKQKKAISLYIKSGNSSTAEIAEVADYSSTPEIKETPVVPNEENSNKEENNNQNIGDKTPQTERTTNYQPAKISLASDVEIEKAKRLEKEALVIDVQVQLLNDSAETVKKKKEKALIVAEADNLTVKAQQLRKDAEVHYANAAELKDEDDKLAEELTVNRTKVYSEELSGAEEQLVLALSPVEVVSTKESADFKEFSETKQNVRRLVKEAEVEYIKADEIEEEANDEIKLGNSLKGMLAGAEDQASKDKLAGQIKILEERIEKNKSKAKALRESATNKEKESLVQSKRADKILSDADATRAQRIASIEKVENYKADLLAGIVEDNVNENTVVEESIVEEEITENVQPETVEAVEENETVVEEVTEIVEPETEETITENVETPVEEEVIEENNEIEEVAETITNEEVETTEIVEPVIEEEVLINEEEVIEAETLAKETTTEETLVAIDEIPTVLNKSIFVITNKSEASYNSSKRIPVSPKLPEGLVFKVQIGAFRNPIPQDHFKGFAPIMAEKAGAGITRYTAGLFKGFNMANEAKKSIRSIGYSDAFVVAFLNGKRISMDSAREMLNEGNAVADEELIVENPTTEESLENIVKPEVVEEPIIEKPITEEVEDGVSTDVRNINGAFYTIQVGVYSKKVTAGQLNNVTPLNSERTASGFIRYTSGVYKTLDEANVAKARIRELGISDAFVTAYNNGERAPVSEVSKILETPSVEENTIESPVEPESNIETPAEVDDTEPNIEPVVEDDNVEVNQLKEDLKLEFKVRLGEYTEDVPVEDASIYLQLSNRGIKVSEENDKTIYTMGSYTDYQSALETQIEMKEKGLKDPKVVVTRDGNSITIEEALELMKNNQ